MKKQLDRFDPNLDQLWNRAFNYLVKKKKCFPSLPNSLKKYFKKNNNLKNFLDSILSIYNLNYIHTLVS